MLHGKYTVNVTANHAVELDRTLWSIELFYFYMKY